MRQLPGVDHEALERLYLAASAKAQIVAAEQLLREAMSNLQIVEDCAGAPRASETGEACHDAVSAVVALREKVFHLMDELP
jgi:hypothetical protein